MIVGQHEDIAEQLAHRVGIDVATVRRPRMAAFAVPICEEFPVRWMFHSKPYAPRPPRRDTSVPLSRKRLPISVVQERRCSVHAEAAFWPVCRRLCVVNVKLTMRLALARTPARVQRIPVHAGYLQGPARHVHRWRQTVWSSRGEGWGCFLVPRRARQGHPKTREGVLSTLPYSLSLCTCTVRAKPPIWADRALAPSSEAAGPLGIRNRTSAGAAGTSARADPDPARCADGLCRADRGHPFAGAAAAGTRELDHRRLRLHPEALRFHAARHLLPRRRRRQGLDLRHLFAAARQSHPYRLQRAVAVAVRQRAGATFWRAQVFHLHGGDGGGRRARASR